MEGWSYGEIACLVEGEEDVGRGEVAVDHARLMEVC